MRTNTQTGQWLNTVALGNEVMKVLAAQTFEIATKDVEDSDFSAKKMKNLTASIMHDVSEQANPQLMLTIAKQVEMWKHDVSMPWKNVLLAYATSRENILSIYVEQSQAQTEFVIVVKDIFLEEVLNYNDFCFELLEDFTDIDNFYIFDEEEYNSMSMEYADYEKMYQRG